MHGVIDEPKAPKATTYTKTEVDEMIAAIVLSPTAPVSIPASGQAQSFNLSGLTPQHELVCWNFSSSPENCPPTSLAWGTTNGAFMIYNTGVTTSETVRPVFAKRNAINNETTIPGAPTPPTPPTSPT